MHAPDAVTAMASVVGVGYPGNGWYGPVWVGVVLLRVHLRVPFSVFSGVFIRFSSISDTFSVFLSDFHRLNGVINGVIKVVHFRICQNDHFGPEKSGCFPEIVSFEKQCFY